MRTAVDPMLVRERRQRAMPTKGLSGLLWRIGFELSINEKAKSRVHKDVDAAITDRNSLWLGSLEEFRKRAYDPVLSHRVTHIHPHPRPKNQLLSLHYDQVRIVPTWHANGRWRFRTDHDIDTRVKRGLADERLGIM